MSERSLEYAQDILNEHCRPVLDEIAVKVDSNKYVLEAA